jgi:glycosyltransferase involved in cell wall biosynthesis
MKILYLCPDLGIPVLGRKGASVHVRELVGAFARAGHRVTLAAQTLIKTRADEPAKVNARVIHVQLDPAAMAAAQALKEFNERLALDNPLPGELRRLLYNQSLYRELKRRFLKHKPDFIYERASLYATAGVRLAEKFNVPLIVELNAPLAVEQAAYRTTGFGELAAHAERWTLTQADAVIVVSTELRKHVLSLGVKPGKIHVMPNGVNPELFCPDSWEHDVNSSSSSSSSSIFPGISRTRTRRNDSGTLGFVGGLRPWHGVEVLPELLARLSQRHPNVRLIIAGDGQLRGELERGFRKRGLTRRVTFTGALLHEQVPQVIRQFDVALAPYPKHDHDFYFSPLKLFEYMACGVAVVAAKQGQVAEVVRHGRTGLLYPPGNLAALAASCERLLDDAALRLKLGTAAAKVVHARFTWDHNAARVVKLARTLARGRKRSR